MRGETDPISVTTNKAVAAAVTLLVGIYVFWRIEEVMPRPESAELANATNTTIATTAQAFELGAVAIVVLFASLILGLIVTGGIGGRRGGGRGGQPPQGGNDGPPPMH